LRRARDALDDGVTGQPEQGDDGYGQSLMDDIRSALRFRACRKRPTQWVREPGMEAAIFQRYPSIERFGDFVHAAARVDDPPSAQDWIVIERIWNGWPDPSRFAFVAMQDGAIWAARDFDRRPACWTIVERTEGCAGSRRGSSGMEEKGKVFKKGGKSICPPPNRRGL
jgi:hypothetical protein